VTTIPTDCGRCLAAHQRGVRWDPAKSCNHFDVSDDEIVVAGYAKSPVAVTARKSAAAPRSTPSWVRAKRGRIRRCQLGNTDSSA